MIRTNLKAVRKFEKNNPLLPKCSLMNELITLLSDLGKKTSPPVGKPSDEGPVEVSNIKANGQPAQLDQQRIKRYLHKGPSKGHTGQKKGI